MELARESIRQPIAFQNWGLINYEEALKRQIELVDQVSQQLSPETIVFCAHPPIVTLGRATLPGDLFSWQGDVINVSRGGRATYHGPSQLVAYPILDLGVRGRGLQQFFRQTERALIQTLEEFGIKASGRSRQMQDGIEVEATGVWIGSRKIASIGIAVRKWISFHGLALNLDHDLNAFQGMKPCGFTSNTMTSMEEILGRKVERSQVETALLKNLLAFLTAPRP